MITRESLRHASGAAIRKLCRQGDWTEQTAGVAQDYYQANLVILPSEYAEEFRRFCEQNPQPCPLIDSTDPGDPEFHYAAPGSDVRTDLPRYCVYRDGRLVEERDNIQDIWRSDHVAFITGCTFSADAILEAAGVEFVSIDTPSGRFGAYTTNIPCQPTDRLHGHMVVNARPVAMHSVERAADITSQFPLAHGGPVHIGSPEDIGVDLTKPDWGENREINGSFVPVFWACGVTSHQVAIESGLPEMITHKAAHMFITDLMISDTNRRAKSPIYRY